MIIEKSILNGVRNTLKKTHKVNSQDLKRLLKILDVAKNMPAHIGRKEAIGKLNSLLNSSMPLNFSKEQVILYIQKKKLFIEKKILKVETILSALTKEGLTNTTYELPILGISASGIDPDYSYLMISGIKINGKSSKDDYIIRDEIEEIYIALEKKMAELIEEDYSVALENIEAFINLYREYLYTFLKELETYNDSFKEPADLISYRLVNMISYFIYCKKGVIFDQSTIANLDLVMINAINENRPLEINRLLQVHCKKYLDLKDKETAPSEQPVKDTVITPKQIIENPIEEYLVNRVVAVPCDEDKFIELLAHSPYTEEQKKEFLAQLRNLQNRLTKESFVKAFNEQKEKMLSSEEITLIESMRTDFDAKEILEDIDALIELSLGETDEDNMGLIEDELREKMSLLTEIADYKTSKNFQGNETKNSDPKVLFHSTLEKDAEGKKMVPKLLSTVLQLPVSSRKRVVSQLEKTIKSPRSGETPLIGKKIPYIIYFKVNEYKVFYTIVKDYIVIIDCIVGQNFKDIQNIAVSQDFKDFMTSLSKQIEDGEIADTSGSVKSVLDAITNSIVKKSQKSKKMNFTPKA